MFSYALIQTLSRRPIALDDLAHESGLAANRVRDLCDALGPAPSQLEVQALARALGPAHGPPLVRAWVWDLCPEGYRELVVLPARPRRPWRWAALAAGLILVALVAQYTRYQIIPGRTPRVLDRWTGETHFAQ